MNKYKESIHNYIENNKNEILSELKELLKIPSVRGKSEENAPFGEECGAVLEHIRKLYEKEGIETELDKNGGYLLSYYGCGEKSLGIFAHADVVPVSDDWLLTSPFNPIEKDGFLVARGTLDDKAAVITSFYCVKIFKDLKIPLASRIVCFAGANEESGMQDIKSYIEKHKIPDFSLVADSAFPLYRGNKGRIAFAANSRAKFSEGISIRGGTGSNVIGTAEVTMPFSKQLLSEISKYKNERVSVEYNGKEITVKAIGISKHPALPEGSVNAVSLLSNILQHCNELNQSDREIFSNIYNMAEFYYGENFGITNKDEEFGPLTSVLVKIDTEVDGSVTASFNLRYGLSVSKDYLLECIKEKLNQTKWELLPDISFSIPHSIPEDDPFVKKLLEVYSDFSGEENPPCYVNAGGTYRQYIKQAVEIGTTNLWGRPEGLPDGHGGAHQPDECINIKGFLEAIEITALMLLECDSLVEQ